MTEILCRCEGRGWLPEMCLGRWRCPCSDQYVKGARQVEAFEHAGQMCARCESMRKARITEEVSGSEQGSPVPGIVRGVGEGSDTPATVTITVDRATADVFVRAPLGEREDFHAAEDRVVRAFKAAMEGS